MTLSELLGFDGSDVVWRQPAEMYVGTIKLEKKLWILEPVQRLIMAMLKLTSDH